MTEEKSIAEMLEEYNKIGNNLVTEFGDTFRPRAGFKDKADATKSLAKIQALVEMKRSALASQEAQAETDAVKEVEKPKERKMATNGKKKTAKKAVKSATPKKTRGGGFAPEAKIHLIVKDNPRREGTKVYEQFELARKSPTVKAYIDKGGSLGSLRKGVKRKWLKVE